MGNTKYPLAGDTRQSVGNTQLAPTTLSLLSSAYIFHASTSCFWSFRQAAIVAFLLALDKAGRSFAANMAIMAMTTRSSISVKPPRECKLRNRAADFFFTNIRIIYDVSYISWHA